MCDEMRSSSTISFSFDATSSFTTKQLSDESSWMIPKTYAKVLFFLFLLSFLTWFLCCFLMDAAAGLAAAWITRAVRRSLRTPRVFCLIWLYTFENAVVPTLACTKSCNSTAIVFSSSIEESDFRSHDIMKQGHTHMWVADGVIFRDAV